jgi:hypothetical protein
MRIRQSTRLYLSALLTLIFLFASLAVAQDPDEKPGRPDNPAAREAWFRKGRQTRNGEPAAKMLHKAQVAKMQMRAARLHRIQEAAAIGAPLTDAAATNNTWTNLGPLPINDNATYPTGYGSLAGRVTAMAVDQTDTTGNTVLAAGAYGGVWKSTNAAASNPAIVTWTPLIDDQPTLSVGALAIQPGNDNVILVGTGEPNYAGDSYYGVGLLRSTDGGNTWTTISTVTYDGTTYSVYGTGFSQITFSTKNPNFVVASVSAYTLGAFTLNALPSNYVAGFIYSTNAGASWTLVPWTDDNVNAYSSSASAVIYNPTDDKFYGAVKNHGFYVTNGTATAGFNAFTRLTKQPGASGALSLTACPTSGSGSCPLLRGALTVRPVKNTGDPNQMYAWFVRDGNGDSTDDMGIWKSSTTSGVVSWTRVTDTAITNCGDGSGCGTKQSFYNLYIAAVPNGTTATDLYAGTINIFKCQINSSNPTCAVTPFQNLTHVYGCSTISMVHPDQHALDFSSTNPNIIYFGNDGGVNRTLLSQSQLDTGTCPSGTTKSNAFDNLNTNIGPLSQFVWGAQHPTDHTTIMGGTQDNGTMGISSALPAPGDAGWWEIDNGDGGYTQIDPVTPTNWYTEYYGVSIQYCSGKAINCNDADFNYLVAEDSSVPLHQTDGDDGNFYVPYILDPAVPTNLIVGTCRVWRGPNDTTKWPNYSTANAVSHKLYAGGDTACNGSAGDDEISALAAGGPSTASGSKVIYATTSGGRVFVTTNATTGFATWTEVEGAINPDFFPISGVTVDSHDATGNTAVVTIQGFTNSGVGHVWRTTNGGTSWTDITGNLINIPVNDVVIDPDNATTIYVATDTGVWVTTELATWSEVGPSTIGASGFLPNVTVFHIAIYENGGDKRLRAWTHGRGTWESVLASAPLTGVTVSPSSLSFTSAVNVTSSVQTATVTNNDATAVTLGPLLFTGTGAAAFQIGPIPNACSTSLAAGATCQLAAEFTPVATGSFSASMAVTTSDASTPTVSVSLTGNATPAPATDFAFDPGSNSTSATVTAGGIATYTFNVDATPTGSTFNPAVTIACSGLPSKSTCSFTNASFTAAGSTKLSIQTTATTTTAAAPLPGRPFGTGILAALALPAFGLLLPLGSIRARRRRFLFYSAFFVVIAFTVAMSACGGGGNTSTPPPTTIPGTPAGTYSVVVTGTYGPTTHTQTLTLIVQ